MLPATAAKMVARGRKHEDFTAHLFIGWLGCFIWRHDEWRIYLCNFGDYQGSTICIPDIGLAPRDIRYSFDFQEITGAEVVVLDETVVAAV